MRRVVFLYNELLDEDYQKQLKLPLEFVCFAYINGAVMYELELTRQYLKDLKLARKRGLDESKLNEAIAINPHINNFFLIKYKL